MSDINFKVAKSQDGEYSNTIDVIPQEKTTLFFEIELKENDVETLRMVIPVWNTEPDTTSNAKKSDCLFTSDVWYGRGDNEKPIELNPVSGITERGLKKNKRLGIINVSNIPINNSVKIKFSIPEFVPDIEPSSDDNGSGTNTGIVCYLQKVVIEIDEDGEPYIDFIKMPGKEITINRIKESKKPSISLLRSNRYLVTVGDEYRIRWDIANEDSATRIELYRNDYKLDIKGVSEISNKREFAELYKYKLIVQKEEEAPDVKSLIVDVRKNTNVDITAISCDGNIILGLYSYIKDINAGNTEANLYAITYDETANKSYLYVSENGLSFKKVFTNKDPNGEAILIPNALASSPGVIFEDKLCLIGGSTFDPDSPGNDIGYYDIKKGKWVNINQLNEKQKFPERMGHSCVVIDKEIWVLGGYHPDTGSKTDIYKIKKIKENYTWAPVGFDLPGELGRCMMGTAFFDNKLWMFGGNKYEPGGSDGHKDFYYYDYKNYEENKGFQAVYKNIDTNEKLEFKEETAIKAGTLVVAKGKLFLLYTARENGKRKNNIQAIQPTGNIHEWDFADQEKGWDLQDDFFNGHSLEAATFDSGVYFRQLQLTGRDSNELQVKGESIWRFYYVS